MTHRMFETKQAKGRALYQTVCLCHLWRNLLLCPSESNNHRLGGFLLWISDIESPEDDNIPQRAVRQAEILAVDFRRRISARP